MPDAGSFDNPAIRKLLGEFHRCYGNSSRSRSHSSRGKKQFASPYLEYLDALEKAARKMPRPYEFDPTHSDGITHADLDAGVRVLSDVIAECQRSLEDVEHARLDLEARSWAREQGWGA